jgi:hypothetical protein
MKRIADWREKEKPQRHKGHKEKIKIFVLFVSLWFFLSLMLTTGCRKTGPVSATEVVAIPSASIPLDPRDPAWEEAPEHPAKLLLQDLVEPRLMNASTPEVRVKAVSNGVDIAFRLEWADTIKNDLPGAGRFVDECAVQVPTKIEPNVPAPQMGELGKPVEITLWRADWQATVDGRGDTIKDIYPNASIDHYPYEAGSLEKGSPAQTEMASRYAPARALGNNRTGPRGTPIEDLIAEGPGSITPSASAGSKGHGIWTEKGWGVVICRRLPQGLTPAARSQIAFAIWEGSHKEVGARKMRTGWIPLLLKGEK